MPGDGPAQRASQEARLTALVLFSPKGTPIVLLQRRRRRRAEEPEGEFSRWRRFRLKLQRLYAKLKEKLDYYEKVCAELNDVADLRVVHASGLPAFEAEARLGDFFEHCRRRHGNWFKVDVALAVLGAFLMPLPGPNLFFFYPAARAYGHSQARRGASNALALRPWTFEADSRLDRVQQHLFRLRDVAAELEELRRDYGLAQPVKLLKLLRKR